MSVLIQAFRKAEPQRTQRIAAEFAEKNGAIV
jgi:hypothetical protein